MEPLTLHTGRGISLRRNDVDTDQIIPAEFCKRLTKSGFEDTLFAKWREEPAFPLNDPLRQDATVLVAAHNFGTGSSREHAVWALRDWGFSVVVASSFGDIFRRNAFKNGLLAVQLDEEVVSGLASAVEADPDFEIVVDLEACELRAAGRGHSFEVDPRARWLLLNGYDDIAVTLGRAEAISAYEASRPPWLPRTDTVAL
ncbi:3-isopropylmalate dehydratase small subunit [Streptomyces sp. CB03238]|uniref:3-isopropylmalate dehydratase small subunit n=1 Tax=Streptomyces sp. CB03238 TaxID=1907777 RepID=UPI000A11B1A4|nr:3-isopropylmalate dehydratase small subunit [Streptomyces sp. CB03238]ORT57432.1 3-isopropylmalate dehydratase small subunit [Streptomyces sp. CB03238]